MKNHHGAMVSVWKSWALNQDPDSTAYSSNNHFSANSNSNSAKASTATAAKDEALRSVVKEFVTIHLEKEIGCQLAQGDVLNLAKHYSSKLSEYSNKKIYEALKAEIGEPSRITIQGQKCRIYVGWKFRGTEDPDLSTDSANINRKRSSPDDDDFFPDDDDDADFSDFRLNGSPPKKGNLNSSSPK
jgi:hypothetical protein